MKQYKFEQTFLEKIEQVNQELMKTPPSLIYKKQMHELASDLIETARTIQEEAGDLLHPYLLTNFLSDLAEGISDDNEISSDSMDIQTESHDCIGGDIEDAAMEHVFQIHQAMTADTGVPDTPHDCLEFYGQLEPHVTYIKVSKLASPDISEEDLEGMDFEDDFNLDFEEDFDVPGLNVINQNAMIVLQEGIQKVMALAKDKKQQKKLLTLCQEMYSLGDWILYLSDEDEYTEDIMKIRHIVQLICNEFFDEPITGVEWAKPKHNEEFDVFMEASIESKPELYIEAYPQGLFTKLMLFDYYNTKYALEIGQWLANLDEQNFDDYLDAYPKGLFSKVSKYLQNNS
ncbi:hypothetical protein Bcop_1879 [Bacteroides coprosuis DSM 18011]|uniref:Uncharacterized protein n=1 Tax=Bacteroides coprosuis DSM 18011 TaxID=679937 RepID=F3ZS46_9BACE|nr:hypothetical protein [Bacteroides coprosuis]EGJ72067.1 hypothetical protein Bcop_1879 [Bacteroides coprosuis DSM 18011]